MSIFGTYNVAGKLKEHRLRPLFGAQGSDSITYIIPKTNYIILGYYDDEGYNVARYDYANDAVTRYTKAEINLPFPLVQQWSNMTIWEPIGNTGQHLVYGLEDNGIWVVDSSDADIRNWSVVKTFNPTFPNGQGAVTPDGLYAYMGYEDTGDLYYLVEFDMTDANPDNWTYSQVDTSAWPVYSTDNTGIWTSPLGNYLAIGSGNQTTEEYYFYIVDRATKAVVDQRSYYPSIFKDVMFSSDEQYIALLVIPYGGAGGDYDMGVRETTNLANKVATLPDDLTRFSGVFESDFSSVAINRGTIGEDTAVYLYDFSTFTNPTLIDTWERGVDYFSDKVRFFDNLAGPVAVLRPGEWDNYISKDCFSNNFDYNITGVVENVGIRNFNIAEGTDYLYTVVNRQLCRIPKNDLTGPWADSFRLEVQGDVLELRRIGGEQKTRTTISEDETTVASLGGDTEVPSYYALQLFDAVTGNHITALQPGRECRYASFGKNGDYIAGYFFNDNDNGFYNIDIIEVSSDTVVKTIASDFDILSLDYVVAWQGNVLACFVRDGTTYKPVKLVDTSDADPANWTIQGLEIAPAEADVDFVALSPDGSQVVAGRYSEGFLMKVWNTADGSIIKDTWADTFTEITKFHRFEGGVFSRLTNNFLLIFTEDIDVSYQRSLVAINSDTWDSRTYVTRPPDGIEIVIMVLTDEDYLITNDNTFPPTFDVWESDPLPAPTVLTNEIINIQGQV